ncbi:TetR family transcriptional regulator [Murinocardiopsis flavida]|uniref:TetR family transcriptional regulator n=1 Tax=Murinocardiopsis flavida TaxID=645275 RepID=A0A2P8DMP6_9ACTN|nr:TetR/AcrR family transcriptional regulator [Murinocardiopsis flavida]PSK98484.1 TetR family transcriptional regulator [Murinocardiopsis flavida]
MTVIPLRGSAEREADLLAAVLDVLRETGYERLTVEAVIARAGTGKSTVHRRWPQKADLVVAAFGRAVAEPPGAPDTGVLRDDLLALLEGLRAELVSLGDIVADLVGELRRIPDLADAMRTGYIDARAETAREVFERARQRGELSEHADLDLLWQVVPATMFFRALVSEEPIDRDLALRLVDGVVLPLAVGRPAGPALGPRRTRTAPKTGKAKAPKRSDQS